MIRYIHKLVGGTFLLIFLFACKPSQNNWGEEVKSIDDMFRIFDNEIKLDAETYINDTVHVINPFSVTVMDPYLLVKDAGNPTEGILSVFDMANKQFIGRMFNYGHGPNEFLGLRPNLYGSDSLLVLDPFKKEAQLFGIHEIKTIISTPVRIIKFQSPGKGEQIDQCYLFDNKLICSGQFQKGRFQIYDTKGKFLTEFDEFPKVNFGEKQIDNIQLGFIFGANVSFSNNSTMSKIACIGSSTFSIYNSNRNEFTKNLFVQWFLPKVGEATYKDGKPLVTRSAKECMVGAGNIVSNDKYIFFSFSNFSIADVLTKGTKNLFNYIFVTNWDGEPVAKLILNKAIKPYLSIDKNGKYLYAIHNDTKTGFSQIIRYDISFL